MILVFINNKLGTIDTVLPILLEMKERYGISSRIVLADAFTNDGIKKNVVINDAIAKVGSKVYIGRGFDNRFARLFVSFLQIQRLFLFSLLGAKIIHFGALNQGLLHFIFRIFDKKIFLCQSLAFEYTGHEKKRDYIVRTNNMFTGQSIIATNNLMPELQSKKNINKKKYLFGPTRMRKIWLEHSYYLAEYYLKKYHPNINYKDGYVVIILYTFKKVDAFDDIQTSERLLRETLDLIIEIYPNKAILIKPHIATQLDILNKIIDQSKSNKIEITYLHPGVLSRFADMFICNSYSNTLADAYSLGVTTIEYTDYKKYILARTKNRSFGYQFVDYFINNNKVLLKKVLKDIEGRKPSKNTPLLDGVLIDDDSGLLESLSN
jgi:hypothetical protein